MTKLLLIPVLLIIAFRSLGQSSDNTPYYKGFQSGHAIYHWTTSNGLPQSHIAGIAQTRNNLMWLATYDGVIQFDGRKFNKVETSYKGTETSSFITAIQSEGDTLIWASTQEIVFYYNGKITAVYPILDAGVFIMAIRYHHGRYYFIAHDRVYCLNGSGLSTLVSTKEPGHLKGKMIHTAVFLKNEMICMIGHEKYLYVFDLARKAGKLVGTQKPVDNLAAHNGQLLIQQENQWLTAGKNYQPVFVYDKTVTPPVKGHIQSSYFNDQSFYYTGSSLVLHHRQSGESVLNVSEIMSGNELFASFVDHTGNLWLGTNSMGLFMFREYPFGYFNYKTSGLITNSSHSFIDSEDLVWFDNDCNMTIGMDFRTMQVRHLLPDICNWVNVSWSEDSLALFAFGMGHHWYNKKTKQLSELKGVNFPVNNCYKIGPNRFILAAEGALYLWDGKKTTYWKQFRSKSTTCNQLFSPDGKQFYFATSEGLYRYSDKEWKYVNGKHVIDKADFRSLHEVRNSPYLLIGTAGNGILRYHTITGKLEKLLRVPAQLQNCWSMIEDTFGQLWVTSNNGIVQLNMSDLNHSFDKKSDFLLINHYRYETGLHTVEFNSRTQNKGYLLPNGKIMFSSLGGPLIIEPLSNASFNNSLGQILLEKIAVNEQTTDLNSSQLDLREGDFVQIQFTLPSFSTERVLNFEYRIKGYRNDWTSVHNRQITLDNLPAGNYQLEIRLTSGKRTLYLPVSVSRKYPNMWILYLFLELLAGGLVIFTTAYFTRQAQRRKHVANSMKQQLRILEMDALRSQMNPHFIFNCLNTIQFLFISGNVDRANKYLSDFSSLMRMTLDLLRQPITTLDIELRATTLYIELEQLQFDNGFEFRLINNLKTPVNQIKTPTLFFQIFVENAILHGLRKTTEPFPILTIYLDETEENFVFRVCDNGPGLSATKQEGHESVGMSLLKERFALKNEIYDWNIAFSMHELKTLENDIRTEIIITFGKIVNEPAEHENPDSR